MSKEYDLYLLEHRNNVNKAFKWLKEYLPDVLSGYTHIAIHDISKYSFEEYRAYDKYFYGSERTEKNEEEFNHAYRSSGYDCVRIKRH